MLSSGTYQYSLYVDGKLLASKQMLLENNLHAAVGLLAFLMRGAQAYKYAILNRPAL